MCGCLLLMQHLDHRFARGNRNRWLWPRIRTLLLFLTSAGLATRKLCRLFGFTLISNDYINWSSIYIEFSSGSIYFLSSLWDVTKLSVYIHTYINKIVILPIIKKVNNVHESSGSRRQPSWHSNLLFAQSQCASCPRMAPKPTWALATTLAQSSWVPHFSWLGN